MSILAKAARWLVSDWRNIPLILLAVFAGWQLLIAGPAQRHAVAIAKTNLTAEEKAHEATVASYRAATAEAELADRTNADRVLTEQQTITRNIVDDYQEQLADVRARAAALDLRLRQRAEAGAGQGSGAAAYLSRPGSATEGAAAASGEAGLPAGDIDPQSACALSLEDAVTATEQALQLDALIDWVEAQALVDVGSQTGEPSRGR